MLRKQFNSYVKWLGIASTAIMVLVFSSCKKLSDTTDAGPVSKLMAFNLATDKGPVDIAVANARIVTLPLNYGSYTGGYVNINPGQQTVSVYDNGAATAFASATAAFNINNYYSVFTVGDSGTYRNVIVNDMLDSLAATTDNAYVRYINAIPDSSKPTVTIVANGTEVVNKKESFATVSAFSAVNSGDITVTVSNGTTISATRTITIEKNKIYSILLMGKPGSANSATQVQIKFIVNGIVT
jgi:hypothetical protein